MTRSQRVWLLAILLLAAALRLVGVDWDAYEHHHPDERYITWVATTIEFPAVPSIASGAALDPATSTFNPFRWPPEASSEGIVVLQDSPRAFAYGHVPLYLGVAATRILERVPEGLTSRVPDSLSLVQDLLNTPGRIEFHHLTAVSRALTGLVDVLTVLLVFLLGRKLFGVITGLLAAALLAVTVMHIQLAHFFTSDPYLTFFVVLALYLMVVAMDGSRWSAIYLVLAGASVGLAVGSKFSAILLLLPLTWAAWRRSQTWGRRVAWAAVAAGAAFLSFAITNPFALLDASCEVRFGDGQFANLIPEQLALNSCYLDNVFVQNAMVGGDADLPFTRQYDGTAPYLYFIEMQLRWGLGLWLGLAAFFGLGWVVWQVLAFLRSGRGEAHMALPETKPGFWALSPESFNGVVTLLLWTIPYFVLTGAFYVKFMRYMQPIVPLLVLFGAAMLIRIANPRLRWAAVTTVFTVTLLYALSFVAIYSQPHPWNAASEWIYANVRSSSLILSEQWDDPLPVQIGADGRVARRAFGNEELTWLSGVDENDDLEKLAQNAAFLAEAQYLTLASQRVYGVVPRLPDRYLISSAYYQLLFDGELGYELVWVGGRFPGLFGFSFGPDLFAWPGLMPPTEVDEYLDQVPIWQLGRVDESFTVYDQPLTMIFENTGQLSAGEIASRILTAAGSVQD